MSKEFKVKFQPILHLIGRQDRWEFLNQSQSAVKKKKSHLR